MKTKLYGFILALLSGSAMAGCTSGPGAMPDPQPAVQVIKVEKINQRIEGLENGFYDLEYYVKGDGNCVVSADYNQSTTLVSSNVWSQGFVRGINVENGSVYIGYTGLGGTTPNCTFDAMSLTKHTTAQVFLKGGDISELSYAEHNNTVYKDADGSEKDCIALLKENGMNIVRLRLYVKPGTPVKTSDDTMQKVPEGYQDEKDILKLAKRANEAGLKILLTFHYSDFWSDGSLQTIPADWADADSVSLQDSIYKYTARVLEDMNGQGTTPDYVSIGNETQAGVMYPYGACANAMAMCAYLNAGCKAVRDVCPKAKTIIHLANAGEKDNYNWYLGLLKDYKVDYDIIGASYYPFWTQKDSKTVCDWAEYITDRWGKDLVFMEVGYGWNPTLKDGSQGQISNNGPYDDKEGFGMTQEGQQRFLLELTENIKRISNHRVLGFLYWDPIYIDSPDGSNGWCVGQKNVTGNSTLFDFDGKILPAFDAFRYNN